MVSRSLVPGVSGVVHFVYFDAGVVTACVCLPDNRMVDLRHRVGARNGIPVGESRILWSALKLAAADGRRLQFYGRPGWENWFDDFEVVPAPLTGFFEDEIAMEMVGNPIHGY